MERNLEAELLTELLACLAGELGCGPNAYEIRQKISALKELARAASPVSAQTKPNIKIRCHDCGGFQIWRYVEDEDVFEVFHDCVSGKSAEKRKLRESVAPVSAEQPTKCQDCAANDRDWKVLADELGVESTRESMVKKIRELLAAPSVASADSATQPEDWMRKAAEETVDLKLASCAESIRAVFAKHYAASQLSTEKK